MSFLKLYHFIERGDYAKFQNEIASDTELDDLEQLYLKVSYHIKSNSREEFNNLRNNFENVSTSYELDISKIFDVKSLSFLIFEGQEQLVKEMMADLDHHLDQPKSFNHQIFNLIQGDYYHYKAIYYMMVGEYYVSEKWFEKAIAKEKHNDIPIRLGKVKNNFSLLKIDQGQTIKAQSINFDVKKLWEETNSYHNLGQLYGNISELYEIRGILDSALYYTKEADAIFDEVGNNYEKLLIRASLLRILRKSYFHFGIDHAEIYTSLLNMLRNDSSLLHHQLTARVLTEMTVYQSMVTKNREEVDEIHSLFDQLLENTNDSSYVKKRYRMSIAISHSFMGRFREKLEAQEIFHELITVEDTDFLIKSASAQYIIDILLLEYQTTRDPHIISDVYKYMKYIKNWVDTNNSLELRVKYQLLQAQLDIYQDIHDDLLNQLSEIVVITVENGMTPYRKFCQAILHESQRRFQTGESMTNWDFITSLSNLQPTNNYNNDLKVQEVFLFDRFGQLHPIINSEIISTTELALDDINENTGSYFVNTSATHSIILKKFGNFPWLGLVFVGDFEKAINLLDYMTNVVTVDLVYSDKDKDISSLQDTVSLRRTIEEFMNFQNFHDYFEFEAQELMKSEFEKLQDYKLLLHPMRLSIMDILIKNFSMPRKYLEKTIEGNRGTFASHLTKLIDEDLLESENQFINNEPLMVVYVTNKGVKYYEEFKKIMQKV